MQQQPRGTCTHTQTHTHTHCRRYWRWSQDMTSVNAMGTGPNRSHSWSSHSVRLTVSCSRRIQNHPSVIGQWLFYAFLFVAIARLQELQQHRAIPRQHVPPFGPVLVLIYSSLLDRDDEIWALSDASPCYWDAFGAGSRLWWSPMGGATLASQRCTWQPGCFQIHLALAHSVQQANSWDAQDAPCLQGSTPWPFHIFLSTCCASCLVQA